MLLAGFRWGGGIAPAFQPSAGGFSSRVERIPGLRQAGRILVPRPAGRIPGLLAPGTAPGSGEAGDAAPPGFLPPPGFPKRGWSLPLPKTGWPLSLLKIGRPSPNGFLSWRTRSTRPAFGRLSAPPGIHATTRDRRTGTGAAVSGGVDARNGSVRTLRPEAAREAVTDNLLGPPHDAHADHERHGGGQEAPL